MKRQLSANIHSNRLLSHEIVCTHAHTHTHNTSNCSFFCSRCDLINLAHSTNSNESDLHSNALLKTEDKHLHSLTNSMCEDAKSTFD